jgi:hypothetical protein
LDFPHNIHVCGDREGRERPRAFVQVASTRRPSVPAKPDWSRVQQRRFCLAERTFQRKLPIVR